MTFSSLLLFPNQRPESLRGNFDPSLVKYKPQKQESISVSDLFDKFVEYKRRKIEPATLAKYLGLQKQVSVFFKNKTCVSVSESVAEKFRDWLLSARSLEPMTVRERIVALLNQGMNTAGTGTS